MFNVCIIDDNGREICDKVKDKIDTNITYMSIASASRGVYHPEKYPVLLKKYDFIFWDATYMEDGEDTITLLEELLKKEPSYEKKCKVLIGKDIVDYARTSDFEARYLVSRVKKLPNIVYGGTHGTKVEKIITCVKNEAKNKGIEIEDKLLPGVCRPELLKLCEDTVSQINQLIKMQESIQENLKDINDLQPNNENERVILSDLKRVLMNVRKDKHDKSQDLVILRMDISINKRKKQENEDRDGK